MTDLEIAKKLNALDLAVMALNSSVAAGKMESLTDFKGVAEHGRLVYALAMGAFDNAAKQMPPEMAAAGKVYRASIEAELTRLLITPLEKVEQEGRLLFEAPISDAKN